MAFRPRRRRTAGPQVEGGGVKGVGRRRRVYSALLSENLAGQSLTSANNGHHH